jgi:hypothetical protein
MLPLDFVFEDSESKFHPKTGYPSPSTNNIARAGALEKLIFA